MVQAVPSEFFTTRPMATVARAAGPSRANTDPTRTARWLAITRKTLRITDRTRFIWIASGAW